MKLIVEIDGLEPFEAKIRDDDSQSIKNLVDSLPIESVVSRWGDEIYFFVDFEAPLEKSARKEMKVGEIAYWPNGPALAIFFGPTPASTTDEPVAASECNIIGTIDATPSQLRSAQSGAKIVLKMES